MKRRARPIRRMARLSLKPGDIVVVEYDRMLTVERARALRTALLDRLPKGVDVLVFDGGLRLKAVLASQNADAVLADIKLRTA